MPLVRKKRVENVLDYRLFNLGNDIIFKIIRQKPETMCKDSKTLIYRCETRGVINNEEMIIKSSAVPEINYNGRTLIIYVGGRDALHTDHFKGVLLTCRQEHTQLLMNSIDLALTEWANNLDKFVPEITG